MNLSHWQINTIAAESSEPRLGDLVNKRKAAGSLKAGITLQMRLANQRIVIAAIL